MREREAPQACHWLILAAALGLSACGVQPPRTSEPLPMPEETPRPPAKMTTAPARKPQVVLKKGGGFYKDDGPADDIPGNLADIPDAEPRWEPIHKPATKPYVVLGREYVPNATIRPYKAMGIASWYGRKFHGQKTSIGEPYNMFAMTAAHPTLAIPSYVRVTNVQNGKSVIVRVTDRGPFHADRVIDLSYTAAWKLGLVANGSGAVEVEAIVPDESGAMTYARTSAPPSSAERGDIEALVSRLALEESPLPNAGVAGPNAEAALGHGVYLQLGAFSNADNAENLRNHLARELDWLSEPMQINLSSGIHRLQLGPYANRSDAAKVAERIRLALGFKPTLVTR
ncbi:MAG: Rare lipoprotein [Rhodocyclaceae bacterium]|nr:Rare lipoprotein [Rhodocyclaceae bacterium]